MDKHDYDPMLDSRYSCDICQETGIEIESREYCQACELGKRRMNLDCLTEPLRHHPFTNAMWVAHHSAMKTERAIAAAEMALLRDKAAQAERRAFELSEKLVMAEKDAEQWRGWINIDHRIPPKPGWYAVIVSDPDDIGWETEIWWRARFNGKGCWDSCDAVDGGQPVTHWMALPDISAMTKR